MKILTRALLTISTVSAFAGLVATQASAAIVCSGDECWHTHTAYEYPADAHVIVHGDDWRWGDGDHFRWHEHEGRGYWHGGSWRDF